MPTTTMTTTNTEERIQHVKNMSDTEIYDITFTF
jgi:hypothetical protein